MAAEESWCLVQRRDELPELRNIGRVEDWKDGRGASTGAFSKAIGRMKHQAVRELTHVRRTYESATDLRACPIFQPSSLPTPVVLDRLGIVAGMPHSVRVPAGKGFRGRSIGNQRPPAACDKGING